MDNVNEIYHLYSYMQPFVLQAQSFKVSLCIQLMKNLLLKIFRF